MRLNDLEERGIAASYARAAASSSTMTASSISPKTRHLITDDEALVHINDAYVYVGWRRASIRSRLSKTSKYYDPYFPQPAETPGKKTYFYRRDLVAYVLRQPCK
jgi:hypothetical protein